MPEAWAHEAASSYARPVWRVMMAGLVTFGLYDLYWFYISWRQVKAYTGKAMSPGWRTFGLFVPILGLVFVYDLFDDVSKMLVAKRLKATVGPGWLLVFFMAAAACWRLPEPADYLGLLAFLPLGIAQLDMNTLWRSPAIPGSTMLKPLASRAPVSRIYPLSYWSLILAWMPVVGLPMAVVGLRRIRASQGRLRGRGLAIGGLVVNLLSTALLLGAVLIATFAPSPG